MPDALPILASVLAGPLAAIIGAVAAILGLAGAGTLGAVAVKAFRRSTANETITNLERARASWEERCNAQDQEMADMKKLIGELRVAHDAESLSLRNENADLKRQLDEVWQRIAGTEGLGRVEAAIVALGAGLEGLGVKLLTKHDETIGVIRELAGGTR